MATRCADVSQFVQTFSRFCDDETFFVATLTMRPVGLETPFSIQLADGSPVMRGLCVVREAWTSPANPFGRPGIRLGIVRLTRDSTEVFAKLRQRRANTIPPISITTTESVAGGVPMVVTMELSHPTTIPPPMNTTPPSFAALPVPPAPAWITPPTPPRPPPRPPVLPRTLTPPPTPLRADDPSRPVAPPPAIPTIVRAAAPRTPAPAIPTIIRADDTPTPVAPLPRSKPEPPAELPRGIPASPPIRPYVPELRGDAPAPLPLPPRGTPLPVVLDAVLAVPEAVAEHDSGTEPTTMLEPARTPGSEYVLPANPLMNLSDESLEGFVDCTLYETTGTFPIDETTPVPDNRAPVDLPPIDPPLQSPSVAMAAVAAPEEPALIVALPPDRDSVLPLPPPPVMPPIVEPPPVIAAYPVVARPLIAAPVPVPARPVARFAMPAGPQRWWIVAVPSVVVLAVVIVLAARASGDPDPEPAVTSPTRVVAPVAPKPPASQPPTVKAAVAAVDPADEPEPPVTNGPPVVGKGPCRITIMATPAGANISIDGDHVGPSPLSYDGPCQKRRIDLAHARYAGATRWATPVADKPTTLDVTLTRPTHALTVTTQPAGATVSIDGRRAGTSPTVVQIMGYQSMMLTVERKGFHSMTQRVYSRTPADRVHIKLTNTLFPKP
ncbi:MAG: PEGA domain-containing protein [Kofleriaceae bacterium]